MRWGWALLRASSKSSGMTAALSRARVLWRVFQAGILTDRLDDLSRVFVPFRLDCLTCNTWGVTGRPGTVRRGRCCAVDGSSGWQQVWSGSLSEPAEEVPEHRAPVRFPSRGQWSARLLGRQ